MRNLKSISITLTLIFIANVLFAQLTRTDKVKLISVNLNDKDSKEVKFASEYILTGDLVMNEVLDLENKMKLAKEKEKLSTSRKARKEASKSYSKYEAAARDKLIQSADAHARGYDMLYEVYKNNLLAMKTTSSDIDANKEVEKRLYKAKLNFVDSKKILEKMTDRDQFPFMSQELKRSWQLKVEGIDYMIEGFCMYLDCEKKKEEEVVVNDPVETEEAIENTTSNNNSNENNSEDEVSDIETTYSASSSKIEVNEKEEMKNNRGNVYYTIQIMALSRKIPETKLSGIYSGEEEIRVVFHEGLWKYLVGKYYNYDEARAFSDRIGHGAFVVPIRDGKRINILEAIDSE